MTSDQIVSLGTVAALVLGLVLLRSVATRKKDATINAAYQEGAKAGAAAAAAAYGNVLNLNVGSGVQSSGATLGDGELGSGLRGFATLHDHGVRLDQLRGGETGGQDEGGSCWAPVVRGLPDGVHSVPAGSTALTVEAMREAVGAGRYRYVGSVGHLATCLCEECWEPT